MPQATSKVLTAKTLLQITQQYKDDLDEVNLDNIYHYETGVKLLIVLVSTLTLKACRRLPDEADELLVIDQLLVACTEHIDQAAPTCTDLPRKSGFPETKKLVERLIQELPQASDQR